MEDEKKHKFVVLKIIGMVIAAILIVFSIASFRKAHYLAKPVSELRKATPISVKVDVSKPGVYSGTIEHSEHEDYAHLGVISYLVHESELTFTEIFDEIEGKIETLDDHGEVITQDDIKAYPPYWILFPFTTEQKTIKITITKPIEKLANTEQVFEGYYLLNGMESLPAGITFAWGSIFLCVGLLITLIIILVPIYKKRRHKKEMAG
ncbi:MAG: hypothetical protein ACYTBP_03920 [Planctomycetota bacterium]|jgi:hypothetical protein